MYLPLPPGKSPSAMTFVRSECWRCRSKFATASVGEPALLQTRKTSCDMSSLRIETEVVPSSEGLSGRAWRFPGTCSLKLGSEWVYSTGPAPPEQATSSVEQRE